MSSKKKYELLKKRLNLIIENETLLQEASKYRELNFKVFKKEIFVKETGKDNCLSFGLNVIFTFIFLFSVFETIIANNSFDMKFIFTLLFLVLSYFVLSYLLEEIISFLKLKKISKLNRKNKKYIFKKSNSIKKDIKKIKYNELKIKRLTKELKKEKTHLSDTSKHFLNDLFKNNLTKKEIEQLKPIYETFIEPEELNNFLQEMKKEKTIEDTIT
tara:strand:- start:79448 stop:80092 length:645 start_codon:yes stop_codon:yes gene_type:complete